MIYGGGGDNYLHGGAGDNVIHGGTGYDSIVGGAGNDTIYGSMNGSEIHSGAGNYLIHGHGHDVIHGDAGNDSIHSGGNNSLIYGGAGNDVMYGGAGADTFAWSHGDYDGGIDTIVNFTLREDRLSFADLFDDAPQQNIAFTDVLRAVQDGKIDVTASASDQLTVTVSNQTVEVSLSDSHLTADQWQALHQSHIVDPANDAEKAALLQQILTNIGG